MYMSQRQADGARLSAQSHACTKECKANEIMRFSASRKDYEEAVKKLKDEYLMEGYKFKHAVYLAQRKGHLFLVTENFEDLRIGKLSLSYVYVMFKVHPSP